MSNNVDYEFRYYSPYGQYRFSLTGYYNAEYWVAERGVGSFYIDIPYNKAQEILPSLELDGTFEIYRHYGGVKTLMFNKRWFLGLWREKEDNGKKYLRLRCLDCNTIIDRRIVYYRPETPQSEINNLPADNAIKRILRENLGVNASNIRDWSHLVQIDADTNSAPPISLSAFAYNKVLPLLDKICDLSYTENDTYLTFDTRWHPDAKKYRITTYVNQMGANRGSSGNNTLYFTPALQETHDFGGLNYASIEMNGIDRRTAVYCGGRDTGEDRLIAEAFDQEEIDRSPFGLWEDWEDARMVGTEDNVQNEANVRLEKWKKKIAVNGHMSGAFTRFFGREFNWGDIVAFKFRNQVYDVHMNRVLFKLYGNGSEEIRIFTRNLAESYY